MKKAKEKNYGSLIIARRSGLAPKFRRSIFGSVSKRLLDELPECSLFLVG